MDILRVQALWTGFTGAPGYSSFYFAGGGGLISDAQQVADRVGDALANLEATIPAVTTIRVQESVEVIDSETGVLSGYQNVNAPPAVSGSGIANAYSAASGAVVNWLTNDVRFGRRIRGRTFIVPIDGDQYDNTGTLSNQCLTNVRAFADTMVGGDIDSEFGVWSRPRNGEGGVFASATGSRVPDMAAVLRSRRD